MNAHQIRRCSSSARTNGDSDYQWIQDNCPTCQTFGQWPALDKTRVESGDRWNFVHQSLHGDIGLQRASRISANLKAVACLAELRNAIVCSESIPPADDEKVDNLVQSWADATGLLHDTRLFDSNANPVCKRILQIVSRSRRKRLKFAE